MEIQFFSRYGTPIANVSAIDLKKGTASYSENKTCHRCGGAGRCDKWKFTGYTCFECGGRGNLGLVARKAYTSEKLAKLDATKAKADAKRLEAAQVKAATQRAAYEAKQAVFMDANPGVIEICRANATGNEFPGNENFFDRMLDSFYRYGGLTENQVNAIHTAIAREEAKRTAAYVGECGKRVEMDVVCEKVIQIGDSHPIYGSRFMFLMRDAAGNRIIYRGNSSSLPNAGESCRLAAKIEEHTEYNGEKQTIISRPKLIGMEA